MDLARLQQNWTNLGRQDPLWAILSDPSARDGRWDMDAFLRTGVWFCRWLERHCQGLGLQVQLGRALDFGCGYGRLTQALAGWFQQAVGVDIAATMLDGARAIDRSGGRCTFVHNTQPDLQQFESGSFDFVLTILVLQHMRADYARGYLGEFLRILRPGGVAFFQVATEPLALVGVEPDRGAGAVVATGPGLRAVTVLQPAHVTLLAGAWQWFRVRLVNVGGITMAASGPDRVQLALRWCDVEGAVIEQAERLALPADLAPGQAVKLMVPARAPKLPGAYTLQVLPARGRGWIETADNAAARAAIHAIERVDGLIEDAVEPVPPRLPNHERSEGGENEAEIEIHGLSIDDVVATVEAHGGEVADVGTDNWAGPESLSAHFTVRKGDGG